MFIIKISGNKIKHFQTGKNSSKRAQQRKVVTIVSLCPISFFFSFHMCKFSEVDQYVTKCVGSGLLFSIFVRVKIVEDGSVVLSYSLCKVYISGQLGTA